MRRFWADSTGLRASLPGYNAETDADPRHFIFDSRNRCYFGAFLSGVVAGSVFNFNTSGTQTYDVMFGKTFISPPPVLVVFDSSAIPGATPFFASADYPGDGGTYITTVIWTSMVDRLRFIAHVGLYAAPAVIADAYYIIGES